MAQAKEMNIKGKTISGKSYSEQETSVKTKQIRHFPSQQSNESGAKQGNKNRIQQESQVQTQHANI